MTYTIGASHGPFTGNGSFAVSKPNGIRTVVTGIPFYTGHDGSIPRRYFRLGRFTMGNADGFQFSHGLEYVQQLLYPMPPVWEILAYDVKDGASCTFYELVDVPDLSLKQPWDRTPLPIAQFGQADVSDTGGEAVLWSYTVPSGRKLYLASARVAINKVSASTGTTLLTCWIVGPSGYLSLITHHNGAQGLHAQDGLNGGPAIYLAGSVIAASRYGGAGNGVTNFQASMSGFLFDA